jgi:hypothetical protein
MEIDRNENRLILSQTISIHFYVFLFISVNCNNPPFISMMMPALAMNMSVRNFFGGGLARHGDLNVKRQVLARQRMITV